MQRSLKPTKHGRRLATGLAVLVLSIATAAAVTSSSWAESPKPPPSSLSDEQLIAELDRPSPSEPDRSMAVVSELWQRRGVMKHSTVIDNLLDGNRAQATREYMVDLLAGPAETARSTDEVRSLLADKRVNSDLRARILSVYTFGKADTAMLRSLTADGDGHVAFKAIKNLVHTDPASAVAIAKEVLANAPAESDLRLSAAYKALLRAGGVDETATRKQLVAHLASALEDPTASRDLKDSAAFALSEFRSADTLAILINSKDTDRVLVAGAVDENAAMLLTLLKQSPDEATIEFVVSAMEIHPVSEFAEPLSLTEPSLVSKTLRQRVAAVVQHIQTEGVPLNVKWTKD